MSLIELDLSTVVDLHYGDVGGATLRPPIERIGTSDEFRISRSSIVDDDAYEQEKAALHEQIDAADTLWTSDPIVISRGNIDSWRDLRAKIDKLAEVGDDIANKFSNGNQTNQSGLIRDALLATRTIMLAEAIESQSRLAVTALQPDQQIKYRHKTRLRKLRYAAQVLFKVGGVSLADYAKESDEISPVDRFRFLMETQVIKATTPNPFTTRLPQIADLAAKYPLVSRQMALNSLILTNALYKLSPNDFDSVIKTNRGLIRNIAIRAREITQRFQENADNIYNTLTNPNHEDFQALKPILSGYLTTNAFTRDTAISLTGITNPDRANFAYRVAQQMVTAGIEPQFYTLLMEKLEEYIENTRDPIMAQLITSARAAEFHKKSDPAPYETPSLIQLGEIVDGIFKDVKDPIATADINADELETFNIVKPDLVKILFVPGDNHSFQIVLTYKNLGGKPRFLITNFSTKLGTEGFNWNIILDPQTDHETITDLQESSYHIANLILLSLAKMAEAKRQETQIQATTISDPHPMLDEEKIEAAETLPITASPTTGDIFPAPSGRANGNGIAKNGNVEAAVRAQNAAEVQAAISAEADLEDVPVGVKYEVEEISPKQLLKKMKQGNLMRQREQDTVNKALEEFKTATEYGHNFKRISVVGKRRPWAKGKRFYTLILEKDIRIVFSRVDDNKPNGKRTDQNHNNGNGKIKLKIESVGDRKVAYRNAGILCF